MERRNKLFLFRESINVSTEKSRDTKKTVAIINEFLTVVMNCRIQDSVYEVSSVFLYI